MAAPAILETFDRTPRRTNSFMLLHFLTYANHASSTMLCAETHAFYFTKDPAIEI